MNQVQSFNFGNISVSFRDDGYLNATAIAAHFGKQPRDYLKTEQTQQYIAALADFLSTKTKILVKENQIVNVKNGGSERGTWLHPKLAIHFARWLDPKFAVWCDEQIEQIISGSLQPKLAQTTVADRTPLRQAVSALVGKCNIDYSSAYSMVHQRFGVESIEEIAADKLPDAIAYIHALTLHSGLVGEVLEKQPAPQGVVLTERQMGHFAAGAYMLDLATRRLADLSEPLKMLGARDKGVSAWTIRDEAEIWIKNCRSALEAVLPQMGDNFYRGSVQESLRMMDALAAR
nr:KilA-N domain-containing protein [Neisseria meningitidis]